MEIKFLGGGQEVGKSSFLIKDDKRILLDCGVKLNPEPPSYPERTKTDMVVLSHAHLDHCGGIPMYSEPTYMNDITLDLTCLLLNDSMKIARSKNYPIPFTKNSIKKMTRKAKIVQYKEAFCGGIELMSAGHIPGSAGVLINGSKRVFYTGDISNDEMKLVEKCELPKDVDVLITESTYALKKRMERRKEEKRLIESIKETLSRDETCVLPCFAIGRSQEILLILEKFSHQIAIDGMAREASRIIDEFTAYTKEPKRLRKILSNVYWVEKGEERSTIERDFPIIISSAGMLGGGPAVEYTRLISKRPESKIIFTGYLVDSSPGYRMMKTGAYDNEKNKFDVKCKIERYELSSHATNEGLEKIIEKTRAKKVIAVHGDSCEEWARSLREKGIDAEAPGNRKTIKV